jgi:hypothetical protein
VLAERAIAEFRPCRRALCWRRRRALAEHPTRGRGGRLSDLRLPRRHE